MAVLGEVTFSVVLPLAPGLRLSVPAASVRVQPPGMLFARLNVVAAHAVQTYVGHRWIITDVSDACTAALAIAKDASRIDIR